MAEGRSAGAAWTEEAVIIQDDDASEVGAGAGGHAGGVSISLEETQGPGIHYMISRSGISYHGKEYAPQEVRPGQVHVTAYPGGHYKVNEGTMTKLHEAHLRGALGVTTLTERY